MNDKLLISFSGGKSSAMMSNFLLENPIEKYKQVKIVFANTGQEHKETLDFVDACDKEFGYNLVWVEALVNPEYGKGITAKIVNYETASRKGEPYEDMCKKYGIPNVVGPFCTRSLKLDPITSYLRSIGWKKGSYDTAIGIRFDEPDRIGKKAIENGVIYPLAEIWKVKKPDVYEYWSKQKFTLNLPEHKGNCTWCWKKTNRKLYTLAIECPEIFDFPKRMEELYSFEGNHSAIEERFFFRGNRSTEEILEESKTKQFELYVDNLYTKMQNYIEELDSANGCSESCEVF